jgi:hypothetical protein
MGFVHACWFDSRPGEVAPFVSDACSESHRLGPSPAPAKPGLRSRPTPADSQLTRAVLAPAFMPGMPRHSCRGPAETLLWLRRERQPMQAFEVLDGGRAP